MVKLYCLGGFREVGKNGALIEGKTERILFEFGLKVESGDDPIMPKARPNAIFVTHGHLDHLGSIPLLYRNSSLPVYGTAPTKQFAELLIKDSLKIARIKKISRGFTVGHMNKMLRNWQTIKYNKPVRIGRSTVRAFDAGHIPGSAMFVLNIDGKRILYTGDFKLNPTRIVDGANIKVGKIDALLMETTYSSRDHTPRHQTEKELGDIIRKTLAGGGIAVLPSFSSRAAELLLILQKQKIKAPIYLDGMAKKATDIMVKNPQFTRNSIKLKKILSRVKKVYLESERTNAIKHPCVIVTTGGCMDGGPIVFYLKHLYARQDCSLILTGFQIPKTAGRYLVDTGRYVTGEVDLKLKMQLHQLDLSGHAGRNELLNFVKKIRPKKVICMHGDYCEKFATELKGRFNINAIAPKNGDIITL